MEPYAARHVKKDCIIKPPAHVVLTQARISKGLTQQQAADACGINIRQYQKFESGERDFMGCAFSLGLELCHALDVDPYAFLDSAPIGAGQ